jgi:chromosome segregation ATPase
VSPPRVVKLAAGEQPETGWHEVVVPDPDGSTLNRYAGLPDLTCTNCCGAGQMRVVVPGQPKMAEVVCNCVRRRVYRWLQQSARGSPARLIGKPHPAPASAGDDSYRAREIDRLEAAVAEREPLIAAVEAQLREAEARLVALEEPEAALAESSGAAHAEAARCAEQIAREQADIEVRVTRIMEIARAQASLERATCADTVAELEAERDVWFGLAAALYGDSATAAQERAKAITEVRKRIDDYQAQLRRLRLGRYAEAQRRLPELRARRA